MLLKTVVSLNFNDLNKSLAQSMRANINTVSVYMTSENKKSLIKLFVNPYPEG